MKTKNKTNKILELLLISTVLNHEAFFINVGNYSIRPYMAFTIIGLLYFSINNKKTKTNEINIIIILWVLFFAISSLSSILVSPYYSINPSGFFRNYLLLAFQILTFLVMTILIRNTDESGLNKAIEKTIFFMLIVAFFLYAYHVYTKGFNLRTGSYLGIRYTYLGQARMTGTVGDPNYFSLYCSVYYWIYMFLQKKATYKKKRVLILTLFFISAILLSQSRTAILINIVVFVFSITKNVFPLRKKSMISFIILLLFFAFVYFMADIIKVSDLFNLLNDKSFSVRLLLLTEGMKNIFRYPFGVGVGYLIDYYREFTGIPNVAHNDFISVFVEVGILGLMQYILMFVVFYIKSDNRGKVIILLIIGYAFSLTMYYFDPILPIALTSTLLMNKKGD